MGGSLWYIIFYHKLYKLWTDTCLPSTCLPDWIQGNIALQHLHCLAVSGFHRGCTLSTLLTTPKKVRVTVRYVILTLGLTEIAAMWKYGYWKGPEIEIFQSAIKHEWTGDGYILFFVVVENTAFMYPSLGPRESEAWNCLQPSYSIWSNSGAGQTRSNWFGFRSCYVLLSLVMFSSVSVGLVRKKEKQSQLWISDSCCCGKNTNINLTFLWESCFDTLAEP